MLKRTLSAAFAALAVCTALNIMPLELTRTSQIRMRAEVYGAAVVLELDTIADFVRIFSRGLDIWCSALPSFVTQSAENAVSHIVGFIESNIPESSSPSCRLC